MDKKDERTESNNAMESSVAPAAAEPAWIDKLLSIAQKAGSGVPQDSYEDKKARPKLQQEA